MRGQYYDPVPFDEQQVPQPGGQQPYGMDQFEKMQGMKERTAGQGNSGTPNDHDETSPINDKVQFSDQQNIKCPIEIKNGIPQRSLNNFHKNQNALVLNNYTVSAVKDMYWRLS